MAFRIRHKPTGRFLQKRTGSIYFTVECLLGVFDKYYTREESLIQSTTTKVGYLYGTKKGAQKTLELLINGIADAKGQPYDWEIVEG